MITWIKKANNFQIAKVQLQDLLSFCLIFCHFQSGVAFKCVAYKKSVYFFIFLSKTAFSANSQPIGWRRYLARNFTKFSEKLSSRTLAESTKQRDTFSKKRLADFDFTKVLGKLYLNCNPKLTTELQVKNHRLNILQQCYSSTDFINKNFLKLVKKSIVFRACLADWVFFNKVEDHVYLFRT